MIMITCKGADVMMLCLQCC